MVYWRGGGGNSYNYVEIVGMVKVGGVLLVREGELERWKERIGIVLCGLLGFGCGKCLGLGNCFVGKVRRFFYRVVFF